MLLILAYHDIDESECNPWTISPARLREHLTAVQVAGYKFAAMTEARYRYRSAEKRVVVTFDDGRIGCHTHARAILNEFKICGCFFICPEFINGNAPASERYSGFMSWENIRHLSEDGHEVGSHTFSHPRFDEVTHDKAAREIQLGASLTDRALGKTHLCRHFASPYGSGGRRIGTLAETAGNITCSSAEAGINVDPDWLWLKRYSPGPQSDFAHDLTWMEQQCHPPIPLSSQPVMNPI